MQKLTMALIHLHILHKEPRKNRRQLLMMIDEAAHRGAKLIVAPELAISGYTFKSRLDMLPYAETRFGRTLCALADAAKAREVYICCGMAEKDPETGILYNSAFVLEPSGKLACRYRKITAEGRWACAGDPGQDNTFETPWGRVGVLICSDTYHSLMSRATALRGADLLLCPSNWPPTGMDPRELWRARALENGFYVASCNRTGVDLSMDCRHAASCICDSSGSLLFEKIHPDSAILMADLPLTDTHRMDRRARRSRMADRQTEHCLDCCLNLESIRDLTHFLDLPQPGHFPIHCVSLQKTESSADALDRSLLEGGVTPEGLYLFPDLPGTEKELDKMACILRERTAAGQPVGILAFCRKEDKRQIYAFINSDGPAWLELPAGPSAADIQFPCIDFGSARFTVIPVNALAHPELILAQAKKGCDLAVVFAERISDELGRLAGVRTIDNMAVAVCTKAGTNLWMPPEGHKRWEMLSTCPKDGGRILLDTRKTRQKRFHDRVDFDCLFGVPLKE